MKILLIIVLLINATITPNLERRLEEVAAANKAQDLPRAIRAYEELFEIYDREGGSKEEKVSLLYEYANLLSYYGDYPTAIEVLQEVMKLVENDSEQKLMLARCLMQMGLISFFSEQLDSALDYYQRAEMLAIEEKSDQGVSIAKNNIGNVYQTKKKYADAISQYLESLEIQQRLKDSSTICNTLYNVGTCYMELEENSLAEQYLEESYSVAVKIDDREIESLALVHLGILKGNRSYLEQSIEIVEKCGYRQVLHEAYKSYSELLAQGKDYKEAYDALLKHSDLSDSLYKIESVKELNELSVKFKEKEKEAKIKLLTISLSSTAIIFLLVVLVLYLTIRFHVKSNKRLKDINRLKDRFVSVISHDIKNPLVAQRSVLELMLANMERLEIEQLKEQCARILDSSQSLLDLLYNLLNWSQLESDSIKFNPVNLDVRSVVREVEEVLFMTLAQKNISVVVDMPERAISFSDYNMLSTIFRNIMSNSIKYSYPGAMVEIIVEDLEEKKWKVSVKDKGIGMTTEVLRALAKPDSNYSQLGTAGERGSGLGLAITKEMIVINGGEVTIESEFNKGTTISFTILKANENN